MGRQRGPATGSDVPGGSEPGRVDPADASLFRDAIGPVRRLAEAPLPPATPRPRPSTRMAELDDANARSEFARMLARDLIEPGDALAYRRDEVPARVLQRLRNGLYAVQDELDLHGQDSAGAEHLLREFLREAAHAGTGCVRIVHGKGLSSGSGVPVLKNLVDRVLRQRADVLAFHSAPPAQGGTGAVLVLLRRV